MLYVKDAPGETTTLSGDHHHVVVSADATKFNQRDIEEIVQLILENLQVRTQNPFKGILTIHVKSKEKVDLFYTDSEGVKRSQLFVKSRQRWRVADEPVNVLFRINPKY